MVGEYAVLVNPRAGSGRAPAVWEALVAKRPELAAIRRLTGEEGEIASALAAGARRLIVVGGDGTVHWVVNRLLAGRLGTEVAFGVVPAGTGSDLARTLGLPRSPEAALARVLAAQPRPFDALLVETAAGGHRFVANIASAGISGVVDEAVNAQTKRGQAAFLMATLSALAHFRPVPCRVRVDGEEWWEGPLFLLAVANGRYFGKGMQVAPEALPDDGLAEVIAVGEIPRWQLPLRLPQIYLGSHLGSGPVRSCRAQVVELEPSAALPPFDVDGEVLASGPAKITLLPGALRVLA